MTTLEERYLQMSIANVPRIAKALERVAGAVEKLVTPDCKVAEPLAICVMPELDKKED